MFMFILLLLWPSMHTLDNSLYNIQHINFNSNPFPLENPPFLFIFLHDPNKIHDLRSFIRIKKTKNLFINTIKIQQIHSIIIFELNVIKIT